MTICAAGRRPCLAAPGLFLLLLMAPVRGVHAQTTSDISTACFSFRSLPGLSPLPDAVERGSRLRLISLPPAAFHIPLSLLWQTPGPSDGAPPSALADAARAIQDATRQSLAALKAGDAAGCVSILAPDYTQRDLSGATQDKAAVLRALQTELSGRRYPEADFEIADLRLVTPTEAVVTMTQRTTEITKDTPPTVYPAKDGQTYVQNNTVTIHRTTVLQQTWVERGADWVLVRARVLDRVTTAVA